MALARDPRRGAHNSGQFAGLGIQFAASILLFLFLGFWLDRQFGTTPWLLILGTFVGAGVGTVALVRATRVVDRPKSGGDASRGPER